MTRFMNMKTKLEKELQQKLQAEKKQDWRILTHLHIFPGLNRSWINRKPLEY